MESVKIYLLDNSKSEVQYGLNWGQREKREPNQAYLQLEPSIYKSDFFPKKGKYFVVDTDDHTTLIFNRAQKTADGCALHTPENNSLMGLYLRKRLGIAVGMEITREDILNYGKLDIDIFKVDDLHYLLNFSKNWKTKDIRYLFEQYLLIHKLSNNWKSAEKLSDNISTYSDILLKNNVINKDIFESDSFENLIAILSRQDMVAENDKSLYPAISLFIEFLQSDFFKQHYGELAMKSTQNNMITSRQIIYYGAPGTGKSHHIDEIIDDENAIRTTFHPDTDYAAFVGAYKPTMAPMPVYATVGIDLKHARSENGEKAYEQKIIYKYVPQAFLKAYVAAWADLEKPFYLVIEEINRGNCAQIFGDLFQLLDRNNMGSSSYPIHADEDIQRFLAADTNGFAGLNDQKKDAIRNFTLHKDNGKVIPIGEQLLNGTKLLLPPNLHIWATMNTSDQSLFPIDSAFKRRWNWKYIPIDYNKEDWTFTIGDQRYSWGDFLRKINPEIYSLTESADKQMGYYFVKANPETGVIPEDVFVNKVLFYLWTDVFKDYDISSDLFRNKEQNRPFRFSDFFENDGKTLENFIEGLKLQPQPITENIVAKNVNVDNALEKDNEYTSSGTAYNYTLNSTVYSGIGKVVIAIMTELAKNLPYQDIESSFRKVVNKQFENGLVIRPQSPEVLNANKIRLRWYAQPFRAHDGVVFSLCNMWYDDDFKRIKKFVEVYPSIFPDGILQHQIEVSE